MISSQQLASDLDLPLETVNASQLRMGSVPLVRFLPRRPPGVLLVVDGIRC